MAALAKWQQIFVIVQQVEAVRYFFQMMDVDGDLDWETFRGAVRAEWVLFQECVAGFSPGSAVVSAVRGRSRDFRGSVLQSFAAVAFSAADCSAASAGGRSRWHVYLGKN